MISDKIGAVAQFKPTQLTMMMGKPFTEHRRPPRELVKIAFSILIVVVSTFLLLEFGVRISGRAKHLVTDPCFEWSSNRKYWKYKSGFQGSVLGPTLLETGPYGSRLASVESRSNDPDLTVAIFGDSITFGQAVNARDAFPARVQEQLNTDDTIVRVLNFGVQGHTVDMMVSHLSDRQREVDFDVVVLALISDDLSPERTENRVDRFGYLTKKAFGPEAIWLDFFRAALRQSHLVLNTKEVYLKLRAVKTKPQVSRATVAESSSNNRIKEFRDSMARFDSLTANLKRVVILLDRTENDLTTEIRRVMTLEYPMIRYVHSPHTFENYPNTRFRVPYDGHPNEMAHAIFSTILTPAIMLEAHLESQDPDAIFAPTSSSTSSNGSIPRKIEMGHTPYSTGTGFYCGARDQTVFPS